MMDDEDKIATATSRGARAASLLENDLLTEAFKGLEAAYIAKWRETTIDDVMGREKLFLAINIVAKVRDHLYKIVDNGKLAAAELRALAETAQPERRWEDVL